jgi:hypothetical protein
MREIAKTIVLVFKFRSDKYINIFQPNSRTVRTQTLFIPLTSKKHMIVPAPLFHSSPRHNGSPRCRHRRARRRHHRNGITHVTFQWNFSLKDRRDDDSGGDLSFAEAYSSSLHQDFQPVSLPYPLHDTSPPSLVTSGILQESTPHHSESPPSFEWHRDPLHSVAIRLHGHAVNLKDPHMRGTGFPFHPPAIRHPGAIPLYTHVVNQQYLPRIGSPPHYPARHSLSANPVVSPAPQYLAGEKKGKIAS